MHLRFLELLESHTVRENRRQHMTEICNKLNFNPQFQIQTPEEAEPFLLEQLSLELDSFARI